MPLVCQRSYDQSFLPLSSFHALRSYFSLSICSDPTFVAALFYPLLFSPYLPLISFPLCPIFNSVLCSFSFLTGAETNSWALEVFSFAKSRRIWISLLFILGIFLLVLAIDCYRPSIHRFTFLHQGLWWIYFCHKLLTAWTMHWIFNNSFKTWKHGKKWNNRIKFESSNARLGIVTIFLSLSIHLIALYISIYDWFHTTKKTNKKQKQHFRIPSSLAFRRE